MEADIKEILTYVYDPELGINIVDLGLVYDIKRRDDGGIYIKMTLTTPGCPMHDTIVGGVKYVLKEKLNTEAVEIDLVWEPEWSPDRISLAGKAALGI